MRNVLFFNSNYAWGGGEKWHYTTAKALRDKGYKVFFITGKNSELAAQVSQESFENLSLNLKNHSFLSPFKKKVIKDYILKNEIDSLIVNLPRDVKIIGLLKNKIPNTQIIYRRGMPHPIKKNFINNLVYPRFDIFIANSAEIKRSIQKNYPELDPKIHIIYNGVDKFLGKIPKENSPVIIGSLGRLVEQKGQYHLIQIAKTLKSRKIDFKLHIGGKGPLLEDLQQRIDENKLTNEVKLLGHVNAQDFFSSIDIFAFPSHFEGSANALIESVMYGIPSVAFNISSMPEMIQHKKTGFLVSPFDEIEMANQIETLILDSDLRETFSKNCEDFLKRNFIQTEKICQLEDIINGN